MTLRLRLILLSLIVLAGLGGIAWLARASAFEYALRNTETVSQERLRLVSATLSMRIERFRYLPDVVARSRETEQLFQAGTSPSGIMDANLFLKRIAEVSDTSALFVTDLNGLTIAASNFDKPSSFVGENYSYRPYFKNALKDGFGSYYAVGATTGEPGYFLATPIRLDGRVVGVSIVKIDLLPVEQEWRAAAETVAMSDEQNVIFLASNPAWRYTTIGALGDDALAHLRSERRYGDAPLGLAGFQVSESAGHAMADMSNPAGPQRLHASMPFGNGWTVNYFADLSAAIRQANVIALAVLLAGLLTMAAGLIVMQQLRARAVSRSAVAALENAVGERTKELREANDHLETEITERQEAERQLNVTRGNLSQAEKLAAIGQTFAGLAHEINQPLAALQTYLSSTKLLIERNRTDIARENFVTMGDIVERMSGLTKQLKRLARRNDDDFVELDLAATVRKTLNLLKFRFSDLGIAVTDKLDAVLPILGSDTQLDQVVLNLLNNAIDAVREVAEPRIEVEASSDGSICTITVDDNGPGIDPAAQHRMFEPFHTTKAPGEGLGLGLATAHRIVGDHNGTLRFSRSPLGGARFTIQIARARQAERRLTA